MEFSVSRSTASSSRNAAIRMKSLGLAVRTARVALPRHGSVFVGKGAGGAVGTDQRHLYCLLCTLLNCAVSSEVVQIRSDKATGKPCSP